MEVIQVRNAWDALGEIGAAVAGTLAKNRRGRGIAKEKNFMAADADASNLAQKQRDLQSAYDTYSNPEAGDIERAYADIQAAKHGLTASGVNQGLLDEVAKQHQMAADYRNSQEGKRIGGKGDFQFYNDYMNGSGYTPAAEPPQETGLLEDTGISGAAEQMAGSESQGFLPNLANIPLADMQPIYRANKQGLLAPDLFSRNPNWGYTVG